MEKYTSRKITKLLAKDITTGKYLCNQKMPSEAQLSIKFNVSRAITSKVFENLKKMDLVYSKPQKGYFVAELFAGITQPYHLKYNINKTQVKKVIPTQKFCDFLKEKEINIPNQIMAKEWFKDGEKIIFSEIWISNKVKTLQNFNYNVSIVDFLNEQNAFTSLVKITHFETDDTFNNDLQILEYKIYYNDEDIQAITRNIISHKYFKHIKKEISF